MLAGRVYRITKTACRTYTTAANPRPVPILPDATLETFRTQAFNSALPVLLPRKSFEDLPAISKWFRPSKADDTELNVAYFEDFGSAIVPLEITRDNQFTRIQQDLRIFLDYSRSPVPNTSVYLAQASLSDLPKALRDDVPTPDLVLKAGKGDIYDTSLWLGLAPTYTPLHRDPNPNLFVQLAGKKIVRLTRPEIGHALFARVQERVGGSASASVRGEEMMQGAEKEMLEEQIWRRSGQEGGEMLWEAEVESGDGLFIPKGWWHSIKGVGEGMTGSVNWWFR